MRILAPFVLVCLVLLAFAVWSLRPGRHEHALPRTTPHHQMERPHPSPPRSSGPAATPPAAEVLREAPAAATQPTVRWASDAPPSRARQRFVELREILVSEPQNEAALHAALELARELQWPNEVCDLLGRLVRLRPNDVTLRFELATQLMRLERWLEALPQLRWVVEQQPRNERAWYNLAIAHQALGHLHDARATWDRVIELMPENPDARAHRGEALLDLRDWSAAAADLETVLRLEPDSLDAALNLSLAQSKLGRLEDARRTLLAVLEQRPRHTLVLNRLAEIAWGLYQADPVVNGPLREETVSCCSRSLAVDADQPEIKALLERASLAGE